jgi:FtsP/CotA-like multicopper oxidase with cupredoxin domain
MTRNPSRRALLGSLGLAASALAVPAWARGHSVHHGHGGSGSSLIASGFDEVSGAVINLNIGSGHRIIEGRRGPGVAVNGSVPGPLIRLTEGESVRFNVTNGLDTDSSIHWHGLLVPFHYDGVPGISFPGIAPGQNFTYEFPIRQAGTYWYHSHSGLQEQSGHYGPMIIEPRGGEPIAVDRDYILLLSEFTTLDPHFIMDRLRTGGGYFNFRQNTWTDDYALSAGERRMWGQMRMMPTDIADIGAPTYTFLANGRGPTEGMEYLFRPGERVRLRIINGAAQTFFNVRIPGLPMSVIATDGQPVRAVEVDEFQIGAAETYDVIVEPGAAPAYTIVAESIERSGMALATLASIPGARAAVPPLRHPPLLTMADMGMAHGDMKHGNMTMDGMKMRDTTLLPPDVEIGPGIDMVSMAPVDKMADPGLGLRDLEHRVLTYAMLAARDAATEVREPSRLLEIHLTGNMERYMWSFDGRMYSAVSDVPIRFAWNERVRVKLINNTMMAHPIHLHGMFFEMVNGQPASLQPRKNTMIVQPGASAQFDLTANEPGDWAFHCHLLYHMHGGMMQTVTVAGPGAAA